MFHGDRVTSRERCSLLHDYVV